MSLSLTLGAVSCTLAPGEQLEFGRAAGPGQLTVDDHRVSSRHGTIGAVEGSWWVRSTASYRGFTVYDCDSVSKLTVPIGAGPLTVPFGWALLAVEFTTERYLIEVRGPSAPGWAEGAAAARRAEAAAAQGDAASPDATVSAWRDVRFTDRQGRVLRWYQTLVAMCEPRLCSPHNERVPSNAELARRLGVSQGTLENHYLDRLRRELGFQKFDDQSRLAAVVVALNQGLVGRNDLAVLNLPGGDS